ncbi:F-box/LRR-repeat protein 3 [Lactuca sativa]|uniref:F-box domain-containing protein n=1 Tax=Lactuca sativa TaxID=4236 RepID=A0A9R1VW18_LACSA|nr:F-box/LRR-repeat protein 3 [Lactuca sativa]KAJ0212358.1 hypothetical protein LSAT_V11C400191500 [Lactuca sativa]
MAQSYEELPEEIWELILDGLGDDRHSELESLSLVCKRLLALTNRLRLRFTIVDQTYFIHGTISPLIHRFRHLKTLDLSKLKHGYLETALHEVARSSVALNLEILDISNHDSIPIEGLKELGLSNRKIKVLRCANVIKLRDEDLISIAKFHPDLEELDVSFPRHKFTISAFRNHSISELMITDEGIQGLSSGLKNLTKINISMNHLLTDNSLSYLSLNCLRLQEVSFIDCTMITMEGVRFMLHNSPNITSISMRIISNLHRYSSLFINPTTSGKTLSSLHFKDSDISYEFLEAITKSQIQLKSISLSNCKGYTIDGIWNLLYTYQSLEFLDLSKNDSFTDTSITGLSHYLHHLITIKLNFCKLTSKSLFTLIKNCPSLEEIEMKNTDLGKEEEEDTVTGIAIHPNLSIKFLNLSGNANLTDECLIKIASVCPNLRFLDVSSCSSITSSIDEVLKVCPEIIHLGIEDCLGVKNIGLNNEPLRLKKVYMGKSGVNDEGLVGIGVRCNELVKIDMRGCFHVTTSAVKYVVKKCEKLKEINMMGCPNLHVYMVDWMVFSRPSLRKLVPPSYAVTSEHQRKLLLRHGCQICDK